MPRRFPVVVIVLMLLVAACGGSSSSDSSDEPVELTAADIPTELRFVAQSTCRQLEGATVESAVPFITAEILRATSLGYAPQELAGALRVMCPDIMTPLELSAEVVAVLGG